MSTSEVNLDGMDDPFKEKWKQVERRYYEQSTLQEFRSYRVKPLIVKANDDLR